MDVAMEKAKFKHTLCKIILVRDNAWYNTWHRFQDSTFRTTLSKDFRTELLGQRQYGSQGKSLPLQSYSTIHFCLFFPSIFDLVWELSTDVQCYWCVCSVCCLTLCDLMPQSLCFGRLSHVIMCWVWCDSGLLQEPWLWELVKMPLELHFGGQ